MDYELLPQDLDTPGDALVDRVILVTGAGSGLGMTAAHAFAAHGATVVLLGRRVRSLETVYDEIVAAGHPQPAIFPMDLATATADDCAALVAGIAASLGSLYGVVHSAALLGTLAPAEHCEPDEWQQVLQVNLSAAFLLSRACLPLLRAQPDARLLFTSAGVARRGRAYWGAYAVSKAGVDALMEVLADEEEVAGAVRVASIDPGPVRTRIHMAAYPGIPRAQLPSPESLMPAYLHFMSDAGRELHGRRLCLAGSNPD